MDTRANVYGQRGVLNLRPCIKMLQQNGCRLAVQHWPATRGQLQQQKKKKENEKTTKKQKVQQSNYNKRRRLNGNK